MKIFISGQKSFGAAVFHMVRDLGHEVVGVACPTNDGSDKLFGQADAWGYPIVDAGHLRADHVPNATDLIVCAHSHAFVGKKTRQAARFGAIGYHPSLLPRHRGRDAVRWAVKMNDPVTGGTVYWLDNNVDTGPIAAQEWCWIEPGMSASELWRKRLFPIGLILLERVLADIASGKIVRIPQPESVATFEPAMNPPRLVRPELPQLSEAGDGYRYQIETDIELQMARFA
jgi:methionyl-tRNA formyltransferase